MEHITAVALHGDIRLGEGIAALGGLYVIGNHEPMCCYLRSHDPRQARFIATVPAVGYRFTGSVVPEPDIPQPAQGAELHLARAHFRLTA